MEINWNSYWTTNPITFIDFMIENNYIYNKQTHELFKVYVLCRYEDNNVKWVWEFENSNSIPFIRKLKYDYEQNVENYKFYELYENYKKIMNVKTEKFIYILILFNSNIGYFDELELMNERYIVLELNEL